MDNKALANLLFPDINSTVEDIEKKYPRRTNGNVVTRFAPSPTGFLHIGGLYGALIDERLAHQNNGVLYLRIEDTDQKREIDGAVGLIIDNLKEFGINFDEGCGKSADVGDFAPYKQSDRRNIYRTFAKKLVIDGKAYPCFCSEDDLANIHKTQEENKINFGYYGEFAKHRNFTFEQIKKEIDDGKSFVLRLRSFGNAKNVIKFKDLIKGDLEIYENDQDIVLLKSDGIPTYHFAHVVDDYLMGTTHVVRGEEWLSTLHWHLSLFEAIGKNPPNYLHTAHVMKLEDGNKRKLSKRKDPEADVGFYREKGYPSIAVNEYLMTLLNSNFEQWRKENPFLPYQQFPFSVDKMSVSGALFDLLKLRDISKTIIANFTAEQMLDEMLKWSEKYDKRFYNLLISDKKYAIEIFSIGRGGEKPRKDIACFSEVFDYCSFFFDTAFHIQDEYPENVKVEDIKNILQEFHKSYDSKDDNELWFNKIKSIARDIGFASETKEYKSNPSAYKGSISDVSNIIRVAITGKRNSPDLYSIMNILGTGKVKGRIERQILRCDCYLSKLALDENLKNKS